MDKNQIFEILKQALVELFEIDESKISLDAKIYEDVVRGLIWTGNGEAEERSARETVQNLFDNTEGCIPKGYLYLGGHRPVQGNYKVLQDGFYIQIHNPGKQNIVFVKPDRAIDLETDIINVVKG